MGLAACGDDPFKATWFDDPDTTQLYSLRTPMDLQLNAGFNFRERAPVRIEEPGATGNWDVALDTQGGQLVLLPPGALGITARAAIVDMGATPFADVTQAPSDTLVYDLDDAVTLSVDHVYVVRSNRQLGSFGNTCVYYAKLSPILLDPVAGYMDFQYVASPVCNSRDLVSPD